MRLKRPSKIWLNILSELCIDLAAGLIIVIFVEPILSPIKTFEDIIFLTYQCILGILFLLLAKKFKEDTL